MKRLGDIIMADDNGNDVSLVSYALKEAGLRIPVQWIKDGKALMDHLSQYLVLNQMPLLIVIDWNMPGQDTVEVLKWIRNQPRFLNVLIVVLTGSQNPVQKQLALEAGANWHVVKSAAFDELTNLISRIERFWSPEECSRRLNGVDEAEINQRAALKRRFPPPTIDRTS
jgi:DNA-binding response OmpR family regulator